MDKPVRRNTMYMYFLAYIKEYKDNDCEACSIALICVSENKCKS